MNIEIPAQAPSYLAALIAANPALALINQEAVSGSVKPMPPTIVADKGKFMIKKDGQETVITYPDNEKFRAAGIVGQPVSVLTAVVLKGKSGREKSYYVAKYTPGQETTSPDCASDDGVKPNAGCRIPQCESCASCAQNVYGSGTDQSGNPSAGKACTDRKVVAIYANGGVYRFAVPPASLSGKRPSGLGMSWDNYCNQLSIKGLPLPAVITTISFDQGDTDYKLNFNFGGMLAEDQLNAIVAMLNAPEVAEITSPRTGQQQLAAPQEHKQIENKVDEVAEARAKKEAADAETAKNKAAEKKEAKRLADEAKKVLEEREKAAKEAAVPGLEGLGDLGMTVAAEKPAAVTQPATTNTAADDAALIDALGL